MEESSSISVIGPRHHNHVTGPPTPGIVGSLHISVAMSVARWVGGWVRCQSHIIFSPAVVLLWLMWGNGERINTSMTSVGTTRQLYTFNGEIFVTASVRRLETTRRPLRGRLQPFVALSLTLPSGCAADPSLYIVNDTMRRTKFSNNSLFWYMHPNFLNGLFRLVSTR